MPCPLCKKVYCDHTPYDRGQTPEMVEHLLNHDSKQYALKNKPLIDWQPSSNETKKGKKD